MTTLPLILSLAEDVISPDSYWTTDMWPRIGFYSYPLAHRRLHSPHGRRSASGFQRSNKESGSVIGKDGFQVCMDVEQFKPSELNVKVVNNYIVVEGKHEEREDEHGHISRHFVRRYLIPKSYDPEKVMSTLSSDGVLTVSIPKPPEINDKTEERIIQIQQTGPAHLNIKDNAMENGSAGKGDQKSE